SNSIVVHIYIAGIKSEATSLANQKLLYKNGYRILKEIKHSEYLDEYGHQIFKCDDGTDRIVLFYKRFEQNYTLSMNEITVTRVYIGGHRVRQDR
uniref:Uncharacterized protein n=1 Tax=Parascaris equorum TaxID=6256 RepID=A0A914S1G7_PAREQ